jgi:hypothetical protein
MRKLVGISLVVILTICWANLAGAATTPINLVGKWEGTARASSGGVFIPETAGAAGSAMVFSITKQVDTRGYGKVTIAPPLTGGKTAFVNVVVMGDEIHGLDPNELVTFHGKLFFNPPGKPYLEGYFLKFKSAADNPAICGYFRLQKTSDTP